VHSVFLAAAQRDATACDASASGSVAPFSSMAWSGADARAKIGPHLLGHRAPERSPFDRCWQLALGQAMEGTLAAAFGRQEGLLAAVNGIYVQPGLRRPR
jgi:hypothetical protein